MFSVGLFFIFFLLFALKLENDLLPWGVVFLPLFLFSFLVLIAFALIPCFRKYAPAQTWAYWIGNNRLRFKEDATIFYCFLVPGIVFLFLILLKLDKVINPRWALVFIPLWLFDLLVLVFSVGIFVVFSCYKCRNKTVQKQEYVASVFFMIGVITLCFGQLLIALTLEGVLHTHISLALIPIHIVCILVGTGFTLGAYRGYKNFIIVRERNNFKKGIW